MNTRILLAATAIASFGLASFAVAGSPDGMDRPPNAEIGKCYERFVFPEATETYQEQVIDRPAHSETRIVPAVWADTAEQVVVREARTEYIKVPAITHTVTETVVVRPASYRIDTVPARYETVQERVKVREAYTFWKRGVPPEQRPLDPRMVRALPTGEVLCLIEVPAEYALVTRQVLREPARQVRTEIPAETRLVTRVVVDQPERMERHDIPAEYRTVQKRVLASPERVETYTVPATYRTVTRTRVSGPPRSEWREVGCPEAPPPRRRVMRAEPLPMPPPAAPAQAVAPPCEDVDITATTVRDVQSALGIRRYYTGARNGVFSRATAKALRRFQTENQLVPGRIDIPTLRALGVPFDTTKCAPAVSQGAWGERG